MTRPAIMIPAILAIVLAAGAARAAKPGENAPPPAAPAPAVPAEPGQTMATFGDWVVRCERPAAPAANQPAPKPICEAAQALVIKGQQSPVAQIAFGHVPGTMPGTAPADAKEGGKAGDGGDAGLTLTVLLPVNISFAKPPRLAAADDKEGATLSVRRCLPGGCLADAKPAAAFMKDMRAAKPAQLSFTDAAERTLTLPLSTRGLAQALDNLARETAKSGKDNG